MMLYVETGPDWNVGCSVSHRLTLTSATLLLPPRVGSHLSQLVWCIVRRPVLCLIGSRNVFFFYFTNFKQCLLYSISIYAFLMKFSIDLWHVHVLLETFNLM